jgi:N-acyl homoserine lactone hydrolase
MTNVKRLYILLCGFEILPKSVSTRNLGESFVMSSPVCSYLLDTDEGPVLFDTGVNTDNIRDAARSHEHFTRRGWLSPPIVLPEHELIPQLEAIGVRPADIRHVVLSHTHCDHTGNIKHFRHAKVWMQKLEHDYAFGNHGNYAVFNADFDFPDIEWKVVEGDWQLMPGVRCVLTRGHMPGHQSMIVDLPHGGTKILVADAGDLAENFEHEILPGETCDDASALASIRRLKQIRADTDGELVLFHDPNYVLGARLAPAFYD